MDTKTDYSAYQAALLALLPAGEAWNKEPDSALSALMAGAAEEFARIDQRAIDLLKESHPSTADELFSEWEGQYGLPDACSPLDQTTKERVSALIQSYQMQGGQSKAFFIEMASLLGSDITITEYQQRVYGDQYNAHYISNDWAYTWTVNIGPSKLKFGDTYNQAYSRWKNERLECVFRQVKPAHMHLIFNYF